MCSSDLTAARAISKRRITQADIDALIVEKEQLLNRGIVILMRNDYAERDRWLNEYRSMCRRINENTAELEAAA